MMTAVGCQPVRIGGGSSPEQVEMQYQRGTAALQEGRYSEAIPDLQSVVSARPQDTIARYNLGVALQRVRSYRESVQALLGRDAGVELRQLDGGITVPADADGDYLYALGTSYQEARQFSPALACFEASIRDFPDHLQSHYGRALVLQQSGQVDEARRAWQAYLKRDPNSSWAANARKHMAELDDGP